MNKWLIIALFFAVMFLDGIIFPALFGFRESFLTAIFMIAILMYYKFDFRLLVFGIVFSGLTELYWGLKMGVLMFPLLVSAGVFFLLATFFNIRSRFLTIISGIIVLIIFWETSIFISKII